MGTDGHIAYTIDGGAATQFSAASPVALTSLTAGVHKVILTLVDNTNAPIVPNASDTVNFTVNLIPPAYKTLYDIQYTTLPTGDSPLKDSIVTTSGVVTASFASGYFIQDGLSPWNGLYVFDNTHSPVLGDSILVVGTVSEYYNYTELKTIANLTTVATGKPVPAPIALNTTTVKDEKYEGMLVNLNNAKCTQNSTAGWWKVLQSADTCEIGKLMFPFPTAVVGTNYDVTGCVNFTFNLFTVEPRNAADIQVHIGIAENIQNNMVMYPNPVNSMLNILNIEGVDQIKIANLMGQTVNTYSVIGNSTALNVNNLKSGIYFISLLKDNSTLVTRKFIKD